MLGGFFVFVFFFRPYVEKTGTFITPANGLENEALHSQSLLCHYFFSSSFASDGFSFHLMHLNLKYLSDRHTGAREEECILNLLFVFPLISYKMRGTTLPGNGFSHRAQLVERIHL